MFKVQTVNAALRKGGYDKKTSTVHEIRNAQSKFNDAVDPKHRRNVKAFVGFLATGAILPEFAPKKVVDVPMDAPLREIPRRSNIPFMDTASESHLSDAAEHAIRSINSNVDAPMTLSTGVAEEVVRHFVAEEMNGSYDNPMMATGGILDSVLSVFGKKKKEEKKGDGKEDGKEDEEKEDEVESSDEEEKSEEEEAKVEEGGKEALNSNGGFLEENFAKEINFVKAAKDVIVPEFRPWVKNLYRKVTGKEGGSEDGDGEDEDGEGEEEVKTTGATFIEKAVAKGLDQFIGNAESPEAQAKLNKAIPGFEAYKAQFMAKQVETAKQSLAVRDADEREELLVAGTITDFIDVLGNVGVVREALNSIGIDPDTAPEDIKNVVNIFTPILTRAFGDIFDKAESIAGSVVGFAKDTVLDTLTLYMSYVIPPLFDALAALVAGIWDITLTSLLGILPSFNFKFGKILSRFFDDGRERIEDKEDEDAKDTNARFSMETKTRFGTSYSVRSMIRYVYKNPRFEQVTNGCGGTCDLGFYVIHGIEGEKDLKRQAEAKMFADLDNALSLWAVEHGKTEEDADNLYLKLVQLQYGLSVLEGAGRMYYRFMFKDASVPKHFIDQMFSSDIAPSIMDVLKAPKFQAIRKANMDDEDDDEDVEEAVLEGPLTATLSESGQVMQLEGLKRFYKGLILAINRNMGDPSGLRNLTDPSDVVLSSGFSTLDWPVPPSVKVETVRSALEQIVRLSVGSVGKDVRNRLADAANGIKGINTTVNWKGIVRTSLGGALARTTGISSIPTAPPPPSGPIRGPAGFSAPPPLPPRNPTRPPKPLPKTPSKPLPERPSRAPPPPSREGRPAPGGRNRTSLLARNERMRAAFGKPRTSARERRDARSARQRTKKSINLLMDSVSKDNDLAKDGRSLSKEIGDVKLGVDKLGDQMEVFDQLVKETVKSSAEARKAMRREKAALKREARKSSVTTSNPSVDTSKPPDQANGRDKRDRTTLGQDVEKFADRVGDKTLKRISKASESGALDDGIDATIEDAIIPAFEGIVGNFKKLIEDIKKEVGDVADSAAVTIKNIQEDIPTDLESQGAINQVFKSLWRNGSTLAKAAAKSATTVAGAGATTGLKNIGAVAKGIIKAATSEAGIGAISGAIKIVGEVGGELASEAAKNATKGITDSVTQGVRNSVSNSATRGVFSGNTSYVPNELLQGAATIVRANAVGQPLRFNFGPKIVLHSASPVYHGKERWRDVFYKYPQASKMDDDIMAGLHTGHSVQRIMANQMSVQRYMISGLVDVAYELRVDIFEQSIEKVVGLISFMNTKELAVYMTGVDVKLVQILTVVRERIGDPTGFLSGCVMVMMYVMQSIMEYHIPTVSTEVARGINDFTDIASGIVRDRDIAISHATSGHPGASRNSVVTSVLVDAAQKELRDGGDEGALVAFLIIVGALGHDRAGCAILAQYLIRKMPMNNVQYRNSKLYNLSRISVGFISNIMSSYYSTWVRAEVSRTVIAITPVTHAGLVCCGRRIPVGSRTREVIRASEYSGGGY